MLVSKQLLDLHLVYENLAGNLWPSPAGAPAVPWRCPASARTESLVDPFRQSNWEEKDPLLIASGNHVNLNLYKLPKTVKTLFKIVMFAKILEFF